MDPVRALERIAFLLERNLSEPYKVRAFRRAATTIAHLPVDELAALAEHGKLTSLAGIGSATGAVIDEALAGKEPEYLRRLEAEPWPGLQVDGGEAIVRALKGDCHTHSDWSDGGSPIEEMARAARDLGREYIVLTDHSPRLQVANGLSVERLVEQLDVVAALNSRFVEETDGGAPAFRVLTGIEVDILDDGSLDQDPEILDRLDIVVASIHSALRAPADEMTARMLAAIANPRTDILGHCTGRKVVGRGRPPSTFDVPAVFAACAANDVAVEINSRPERKDPPMELLRAATSAGCTFAIDSDAHAPGQLSFLPIGAERAERCDITADRIINTRSADDLVAWARAKRHGARRGATRSPGG